MTRKEKKYLTILGAALVASIAYNTYNIKQVCKTKETYFIRGTEHKCVK